MESNEGNGTEVQDPSAYRISTKEIYKKKTKIPAAATGSSAAVATDVYEFMEDDVYHVVSILNYNFL